MSPTARQLLILAGIAAIAVAVRRARERAEAQPIVSSYKFLEGRCLEVSRDLLGRLRETPVDLSFCLPS